MQSLSQASHIHTAPTTLLPVITSLASTSKAISPWENCCPPMCVWMWTSGTYCSERLGVLVHTCVRIEVLIRSSDRDVKCYLCKLKWKILWCGLGAQADALCYIFLRSVFPHVTNHCSFFFLGRVVHAQQTNGTEPTAAAQPMRCITSAWRKVNSLGNTRAKVSPSPPFMLTKSKP